MATKPAPRAENVGRPDFLELEKQGRLQHGKTRGFNSLPNPEVALSDGTVTNRGHVRNPDFPAWRAGMNAEKYHAMTLKYEDMIKRGKKTDDFRPELTSEEQDDYAKFLKDKEPKK